MAISPTRPVAAPAAPAGAGPDRPRWAGAVLLANLVAQVGIVVTGGLVRLTGSGLGCPTWPQCVPGSYTPVVNQPQGWHKYIEFGNRMLISVVSVLAVATLATAVALVRRDLARRRSLLLAAVPLAGVAAQAVLGGITVLTGLRPGYVAAHFLLSMLLVAASALLWLAAGRTRPALPAARREVRRLAAGTAGVAAVVLVLGTVVTGSGPHSGDADTPARFGVDPRTAAWLHADAVWLFVGLVIALLLALRLTGTSRVAERRALALLGVTLLQGVIGYAQYLTGLPIGLVSLHTLGASLLVVAVTAVLHGIPRGGRTGWPAAGDPPGSGTSAGPAG